MTSPSPANEICLCGSVLAYAECCELYHAGQQRPATAEKLMRSRFTAYAKRNAEYLLASWDTCKRPASIDFSKETAVWQRLQIINCKKGGAKDNKGIVEFKAFYNQDGEDCFMHEISRFIRTAGYWQYLDGEIKSAGKVKNQVNAGKNAQCACGSGKKFKRCCGV